MPGSFDVYLEAGSKKVFAAAIDWPGWCRPASDEASALEALVTYGHRYERAISGSGVRFLPPASPGAFAVRQRIAGGPTTDFGVPHEIPTVDWEQLSGSELDRLESLLQACWRAFDTTVEAARGKELRKGPRGGGRDLANVVEHATGADAGYLGSLGWPKPKGLVGTWDDRGQLRAAILEGLRASAAGEIAPVGPRGGKRWPASYFVRRSAWHTLDHAWEIEDRAQAD